MLDGLKILVADDHPAVLTIFERVLPTLGAAAVRIAMNGSMAIDLLRTPGMTFDCIIADVYMGPGNGLQLLHVVRSGQLKFTRPDTCYLLMSGKPNAEIAGVARDLDVNGFLAKPFTPQSLAAGIIKARRRAFPLEMSKYQTMSPDALALPELVTAH